MPAATGPSALEALLAKGRVRATSAMLGPAFVAAVAYVDPGNFATNVTSGAGFGYRLLWVVLAANMMAMPIQYLSAKLGIVTGHSLPELCRKHYPRPVAWVLWVQAEVMAMATDVAEFLGAALALNLLFGMELLPAGLLTGVIAVILLELHRRGMRWFEMAITGLLGVVFTGFFYQALRIEPSLSGSARGLLPALPGSGSLYLAVGIIGATVMPHVIYLHSALTQGRMPVRDAAERRHVLRFARLDVIVALSLAGMANMAMLAIAAKLFHNTPVHPAATTLMQAHDALAHLVGGSAALAFAIALFASGIASSSVGTFAGQVVMAGFVRVRVPMLIRRGVTMIPALAILATGINATEALVLSQVVLSFGIPFALIPLVALTSRHDVMNGDVNHPAMTTAATVISLLISVLNALLLYQQFK